MERFIDKLLKCLPEVRRSFYARGFELPQIYLAAIESMRRRSNQEHDYQHYRDEVLRESVGLKYPWQPALRTGLKSDERSEYLDMLAAYSSGDSAGRWLDPNFNLFVAMDADAQKDLLQKLRVEKQKEVDRHFSAFAEVIDAKDDPQNTAVAMLLRIAEWQGYRAKRKVKARDVVLELESLAAQPVKTTMRVVDLRALEKRGDVVVQYFIDEIPSKPFGLNSFVPGGYLYSEWNKSVQVTAFAFYAQCRFLNDLTEGLARGD